MKKLILALFLTAAAWPAWGADPPVFMRAATTHALDFTGTAVSISQGGTGPFITVVRVHPTEDMFIAIGVTPQFAHASTAVFMPADVTEFFSVRRGATSAISVVFDGTSGTVYITEMDF